MVAAVRLNQSMATAPSSPGTSPPDEGGRRGPIARAVAAGKDRAARASAWALSSRDSKASVDIGFRFAEGDKRVAAGVLAGGIAYRLFFWLIALAFLLGGVFGFLDRSSVESAAAHSGLGVALADAVGDAARDSATARWWLLVIGGWLLLWSGYTGTKALVLVHATVWGVTPPRLGNPLVASLVFTGGALGYMAAMAAARWLRAEIDVLGLIVTLALVALPFAGWMLASRALPNRAETLLDLVPGALLVAVGVQALYLFTALFLGPKLSSATALYGAVGIATTILFWLFIVGRLVIAAAILNAATYDRAHGRAR